MSTWWLDWIGFGSDGGYKSGVLVGANVKKEVFQAELGRRHVVRMSVNARN